MPDFVKPIPVSELTVAQVRRLLGPDLDRAAGGLAMDAAASAAAGLPVPEGFLELATGWPIEDLEALEFSAYAQACIRAVEANRSFFAAAGRYGERLAGSLDGLLALLTGPAPGSPPSAAPIPTACPGRPS